MANTGNFVKPNWCLFRVQLGLTLFWENSTTSQGISLNLPSQTWFEMVLWFSSYQVNHDSDRTWLKLSLVSNRIKLEFSEANIDSSLIHPKFGNFLKT